jgi:hypothetical protein
LWDKVSALSAAQKDSAKRRKRAAEEEEMVRFNFPPLSMTEAEAALVELWTRAAEYNVDSPRVTFKFHGLGLVSIALDIDESAAAQRMTLSLRNFAHRRRCWKVIGLPTRNLGEASDVSRDEPTPEISFGPQLRPI